MFMSACKAFFRSAACRLPLLLSNLVVTVSHPMLMPLKDKKRIGGTSTHPGIVIVAGSREAKYMPTTIVAMCVVRTNWQTAKNMLLISSVSFENGARDIPYGGSRNV